MMTLRSSDTRRAYRDRRYYISHGIADRIAPILARMKSLALAVAVVVLGGGVGCGSDSQPGGPADAGPDAIIDADIPAGWTPLIARSWTLPPGATNTYRCTRIRVANEMWISGFRALAPLGTHHTVMTISTNSTQTGDYDCSPGSLDTQMLYASGVGTDDLVF